MSARPPMALLVRSVVARKRLARLTRLARLSRRSRKCLPRLSMAILVSTIRSHSIRITLRSRVTAGTLRGRSRLATLPAAVTVHLPLHPSIHRLLHDYRARIRIGVAVGVRIGVRIGIRVGVRVVLPVIPVLSAVAVPAVAVSRISARLPECCHVIRTGAALRVANANHCCVSILRARLLDHVGIATPLTHLYGDITVDRRKRAHRAGIIVSGHLARPHRHHCCPVALHLNADLLIHVAAPLEQLSLSRSLRARRCGYRRQCEWYRRDACCSEN